MAGKFFLTIDVGTSVTKTVLYDTSFRAVASSSEENVSRHDRPCWLEQHPDQWWSSVTREIRRVIEGIKPNEILGIATCAQMHAPILVDHEGNALFPCLSWPDGRTVELVEEISKATGVAQPYFTSTAPKILWIKRHKPNVIEKTYKILLPKDYIRMKLSREFCTDTADAQGTAMYEGNTWNWKVVDYIGLEHEKLPDVYPPNKVVGGVTEKAAKETGLEVDTPVITGTADFWIGRSVERAHIDPGSLLIYLGTGPGIEFVTSKDLRASSRHNLCILGVAGTAPQWFKNNFYGINTEKSEEGATSLQLLDSEAEKIEVGAGGLIFLPHLMGERAFAGKNVTEEGRLNPYARGVFCGLCMGHTRTHMFRAVLEGVAYHLRLCWERMREADPSGAANRIITTGGGAKSRLWRQIIADIFQLPTCRLRELETSTLGLACLVATGIGMCKSFEEAVAKIENPIVDEVKPDPNNFKKYEEMFIRYKRLELLLEEFFKP